jgi:hypothetical protein
VNAERGLFIEAVFVGAILLSQSLQFRRIGRMSKQQLQDEFAVLVYRLRPGSYDQIWLYLENARHNEPGPAAMFYFHKANPASSVGL